VSGRLCISEPVSGIWKPIALTKFKIINSFLGMRRHATLNAKLDAKVRKGIPIKRGADGEDYYAMEYDLHAHYFSAHCEVSFWFEDKHQGSVKVIYF
jgi:hypothetical protein